jgi:hypothetical protein
MKPLGLPPTAFRKYRTSSACGYDDRVIRRRSLTVASAVSLLLCVAALVLWLASYAKTFSVRFSRPEGELFVLFDRGLVQIDAVRGDTTDSGWGFNDFRRMAGWGWDELNMFAPHASWFRSAGFGGESYSRNIGTGFWPMVSLPACVLFFPLWAVVIASLPLPIMWAIRRRRRGDRMCCPTCSYNLTGNTSGVCPECGTPTSDRKVTAWHRSNA